MPSSRTAHVSLQARGAAIEPHVAGLDYREPMSDAAIRVVPVDEVPWHDVQTVFGTRGDPAGCWCQWFKASTASWRHEDTATRQSALQEQAHGHPAPGLIAYLHDEPAGWVAVEPRSAYPRLLSSRLLTAAARLQEGFTPADDEGIWSVTCFVVRVGYRRRGIAGSLLAAAIGYATASGARIIEAYPNDTDEKKVSSADLYHGPLSTFLAAGFTVTLRPETGRAVVRFENAQENS